MLQTRLSRRIAALKVLWKPEEGHGVPESECTTADTLRPAKANSTFGSLVNAGPPFQDLSNSVWSIGLLSSATNLCIKGHLLEERAPQL